MFTLAKRLVNALNRRYHELGVFPRSRPADAFASIWRHNYWEGEESRSGPGSSMAQTESLRAALPGFVSEHGITSMLDAPCGDLHWMRTVLPELPVRYVGGDIVPGIIEENKARHASQDWAFQLLDVTTDELPSVDLWMCRALLFHLSNRDVLCALENFARSEISWLFMTNCVTDEAHRNTDINTGDFRVLNLRLPPFELPEPRLEIPDCLPPSPPMTMALWHRDEVKAALPRIREALHG